MKFEIPLNPVTKKNHGRIVTIGKYPRLLPSKQFVEYEKKCKPYIPALTQPIDYPIRLRCKFYMETRRKCDITNLLQAICDILVDYNVIVDDNYTIIDNFDGTRVYYDKQNPRTVVEIEKVEN